MDEARQKAFKKLLEDEHEWPGPYQFKFIVPSEQIDMITNLLPDVEIKTRFSGQGKFTSLSFQIHCETADEVVAVYVRVKNVPGLMAL